MELMIMFLVLSNRQYLKVVPPIPKFKFSDIIITKTTTGLPFWQSMEITVNF